MENQRLVGHKFSVNSDAKVGAFFAVNCYQISSSRFSVDFRRVFPLVAYFSI